MVDSENYAYAPPFGIMLHFVEFLGEFCEQDLFGRHTSCAIRNTLDVNVKQYYLPDGRCSLRAAGI